MRDKAVIQTQAPVAHLDTPDIGILERYHLRVPPANRIKAPDKASKRWFDIFGATLALLIFSPLLLLTMIAIKIESRGAVLFRQKRALSLHDAPFDFLKFRSMHHEADQRKESLLARNQADGLLFKLRNDPRRTRVGKFIRRFSIDELPQLINVLRGEMSLVGPRPLPVRDLARIRKHDHSVEMMRQRAIGAKPGMTGLWQISGRSDLSFRAMVRLDVFYATHQTIGLDLVILVKTIPVVLFGKGAY
jgi:lipopolysaccharide/colanic/teichoic acid biosynthesis glycosyltransferase